MMRKRLQTLRQDQHTLGRLQLTLTCNPNKTLYVGIGGAQDLQLPAREYEDVVVRSRCIITPSKPVEAVVSAMQGPLQPALLPLAAQTATHKSGSCPVFDEEFLFDLALLTESELKARRLYISVVAGTAVDAHDHNCIGCMSFDVSKLMSEAARLPSAGAGDAEGSQPHSWYWLFSSARGTIAHERVVQQEDKEAVRDADVQIAGRAPSAPNAIINGYYVVQHETFGGRPTFKQVEHGLHLFFSARRSAWVISDQVGQSAPYAYVEDEALHPGFVMEAWWIFNRGREFRPFETLGGDDGAAPGGSHRGEFVRDADIRSFLAGPFAEMRLQQEEFRLKTIEAAKQAEEDEKRREALLEESRRLELEKQALLAELAEEEALKAEQLAATKRLEQATIETKHVVDEGAQRLRETEEALKRAAEEVRAARDKERARLQEEMRLRKEQELREQAERERLQRIEDEKRREIEAKEQVEREKREAIERRQAQLLAERERAIRESQERMQAERDALRQKRDSLKTGKQWKPPTTAATASFGRQTSQSKLDPIDQELRDTHVPARGFFQLTKPLRSADSPR